jgi:hypothetical protein
MTRNTKPAVTSGGRGGEERGGAALQPQDSTEPTKRKRGQPLFVVVNGKTKIGGILYPRKSGAVLRKVCKRSLHMLTKPPAWALDASVLREAAELGAETVEVRDQETGNVYRAALSAFTERGLKVHRGCGDQVALPIDCWRVDVPGAPRQLTLKL